MEAVRQQSQAELKRSELVRESLSRSGLRIRFGAKAEIGYSTVMSKGLDQLLRGGLSLEFKWLRALPPGVGEWLVKAQQHELAEQYLRLSHRLTAPALVVEERQDAKPSMDAWKAEASQGD